MPAWMESNKGPGVDSCCFSLATEFIQPYTDGVSEHSYTSSARTHIWVYMAAVLGPARKYSKEEFTAP